MKFTVDKEELEAGVAVVNRVIPKKATVPAVSNVLITAEGGLLKLAGTNLETSITTSIGARIEDEGAAALPAQLFFDYLKSRQDKDVTIEPEDGSLASGPLLVKAGRGRARMRMIEAREFPVMPEVKDGTPSVVADKGDFRQLISQVVFAVAKEESRPVLTGCEVRIDGDELTLAAADGFRLAVAKGTASQPAVAPAKAVIPHKGLLELQRLLRGDGTVTITIEPMGTATGGRLFFDVQQNTTGLETRLVCQLIHGTFPQYETLIPDSYKTRIAVPVKDAQRAVKTVSVMARDNAHIVRLVVGKDGKSPTLSFTSKADELGHITTGIDLGHVEGKEDNRVAVNSRFLADVLPLMAGSLNMEITDAGAPVVFRSPDSEQYVYVVMPMQITWLDAEIEGQIAALSAVD